MKKLEELEEMFKEIGLGSEEERQHFLKLYCQELGNQKQKEYIFIRLGSNSQPNEENRNA